jgi:uncharacterized protein
VIEQLGAKSLVIGGNSLGGRIASLVADETKIAGIVCPGYPYHPVGKPGQLRVKHVRTPPVGANRLYGSFALAESLVNSTSESGVAAAATFSSR